MRGAFNAKPPQPRYTEKWDVGVVLRHLRIQEPIENLNREDLTMRLAMLMALVSAARSHELCYLDSTLMEDHGNKITFQMGKLTKSRRQGRPHQSLTFSEYEHEDLDVLKSLRKFPKVRSFVSLENKSNNCSCLVLNHKTRQCQAQ